VTEIRGREYQNVYRVVTNLPRAAFDLRPVMWVDALA
jgi:hypothetical protein